MRAAEGAEAQGECTLRGLLVCSVKQWPFQEKEDEEQRRAEADERRRQAEVEEYERRQQNSGKRRKRRRQVSDDEKPTFWQSNKSYVIVSTMIAVATVAFHYFYAMSRQNEQH